MYEVILHEYNRAIVDATNFVINMRLLLQVFCQNPCHLPCVSILRDFIALHSYLTTGRHFNQEFCVPQDQGQNIQFSDRVGYAIATISTSPEACLKLPSLEFGTPRKVSSGRGLTV
jgi:hypothetical protein